MADSARPVRAPANISAETAIITANFSKRGFMDCIIFLLRSGNEWRQCHNQSPGEHTYGSPALKASRLEGGVKFAAPPVRAASGRAGARVAPQAFQAKDQI